MARKVQTKKLQDEIFRTCRAVAFVRFMQAQGKTPFLCSWRRRPRPSLWIFATND